MVRYGRAYGYGHKCPRCGASTRKVYVQGQVYTACTNCPWRT